MENGYAIFDSGATGHAISKFQLDLLREDDPSLISEIDPDRRKLLGFGGGTNTVSLGVATHKVTHGPLSYSQTPRLSGMFLITPPILRGLTRRLHYSLFTISGRTKSYLTSRPDIFYTKTSLRSFIKPSPDCSPMAQ